MEDIVEEDLLCNVYRLTPIMAFVHLRFLFRTLQILILFALLFEVC